MTKWFLLPSYVKPGLKWEQGGWGNQDEMSVRRSFGTRMNIVRGGEAIKPRRGPELRPHPAAGDPIYVRTHQQRAAIFDPTRDISAAVKRRPAGGYFTPGSEDAGGVRRRSERRRGGVVYVFSPEITTN